MSDDLTRRIASSVQKSSDSIDTAIETVGRTVRANELLAGMPGHEETGQEGIIAAEQELALLEAERELFARGEAGSDAGSDFLADATATIHELADEDRHRRESRRRG
jgi:hypothetical protein